MKFCIFCINTIATVAILTSAAVTSCILGLDNTLADALIGFTAAAAIACIWFLD